MPIEVECKLRLPDERAMQKIQIDPRVVELAFEPWTPMEMDAAYYDTTTNDLNNKKWTLRLRKENGVSIAGFKTMSTQEDGVFSRKEWQCEADSLEDGIPKLISVGAPEELGLLHDFVERVHVKFIRHRTSLRFSDGSIAELACDTGNIIAGEKRQPFLELELELLAGEQDMMVAFAKELEQAYSLDKEMSSKYQRALRMIRSR